MTLSLFTIKLIFKPHTSHEMPKSSFVKESIQSNKAELTPFTLFLSKVLLHLNFVSHKPNTPISIFLKVSTTSILIHYLFFSQSTYPYKMHSLVKSGFRHTTFIPGHQIVMKVRQQVYPRKLSIPALLTPCGVGAGDPSFAN